MFNYKPSEWKIMENRGQQRATILKTPVTDKYDIGAVLGSYVTSFSWTMLGLFYLFLFRMIIFFFRS